MFSLILIAFAAFTAIIISYFRWSFKYWEHRNIPYITPRIPFGNATNPFSGEDGTGVRLKHYCKEMKSRGYKHFGIHFYTTPALVVIDPKCVEMILTRNFEKFSDRGEYYNEKSDPLSAHLFALNGEKWKKKRTQLVHAFTISQTKNMFENLKNCGQHLVEMIDFECSRKRSFNMIDVMRVFHFDVVASTIFELNPLEADLSKVREHGRKLVILSKWQMIKKYFVRYFRKLATTIGVRVVPKNTTDFFNNSIKRAMDKREPKSSKSFLQSMINLSEKFGLDFQDIAQNSFLVFSAKGGGGSWCTLSLAVYELAQNSEIQNRLRDEIKSYLPKHQGKITYEAVMEMKYLNQVVKEILRKYPLQILLKRICLEDFTFPEENVTIEKGTPVIIPVLGIHHDEEYYPNPEVFDPERFNDDHTMDSKDKCRYLPFGEGPRKCIARHFAILVLKFALISMISNYKFSVDTKRNPKLNLSSFSTFLLPKDGVWLHAQKV